MIKQHQAKYFTYEGTKKAAANSPERFEATLMVAKGELNPYEGDTALFAFKVAKSLMDK